MTIYQKILKDHQRAQVIYTEIVESKDADEEELEGLLDDLVKEMTLHNRAEEDTFYDYLKKDSTTQALVSHSEEEHQEAEKLFEELESFSAGKPEWYEKLKEIMDKIFHHMEEEEGKIFAQAREVINVSQEKSLADEFERKKAIYEEQYDA